jgi:hypothetical protein
MARRGDALYLRDKTWYLDALINGTRYQKRPESWLKSKGQNLKRRGGHRNKAQRSDISVNSMRDRFSLHTMLKQDTPSLSAGGKHYG